MKKGSVVFLQLGIVFIGIFALVLSFYFPLTEGRATHLDVVRLYADPFLIYGYISSIVFYIALYQAFKLLGYIGNNEVFSTKSVKSLRLIKYCAVVISGLIILAAIYIRIFHAKDDDPAGFMAVSIVAVFISIVVATAAAVFEKLLQNAGRKTKGI